MANSTTHKPDSLLQYAARIDAAKRQAVLLRRQARRDFGDQLAALPRLGWRVIRDAWHAPGTRRAASARHCHG